MAKFILHLKLHDFSIAGIALKCEVLWQMFINQDFILTVQG